MGSHGFLSEAFVLFGSAIIVATILRVLRIPSIIGFLLAGMAIGPSGWRLITPEAVEEFSEIGIILLLFTVGLELSPKHLLQAGSRLIRATALQFALVGALTMGVLWIWGQREWGSLLILGTAVALSSTAIVLKLLHDRGEADSTAGLIATGVLLLQDVVVIIVMLVLSTFHGGAEETITGIVLKESGALVALVVVVVAARFLLPRLLDVIVRYGGRELTALFAVLMACGGAWAAGVAGWSLGLGACIAGLLLADADHRHQLVAEITPFRDVFNALFFVSLGMLVDLQVVLEHALPLTLAVAATIVLKSGATAVAVCWAGWPLRIALAAGIGLATVSEFAYVLADQAAEMNYLSPGALTLMIAYTVGTMIVGTLLFPLGAPLADFITQGRRTGAIASAPADAPTDAALHDHVIVVGYGVTGHNLAQVLKATHIPFCVVEMNPGLVRQARAQEALTIVGDATRMSILEHAGVARARAVVVAINDARAGEQIVAQVSARHPEVYTLVRVRFVRAIDALYKKGAKLVIPEDFETSIEMAAHLLKEFRIPGNIINAQLAAIRAGGYGVLRGRPADRAMHLDLLKILEMTVTETFYLEDDSPVANKSLREIDLRARTGCSVIAVVRHGQPNSNLDADFELLPGDVLVLVGAHAQLNAARVLLGVTANY